MTVGTHVKSKVKVKLEEAERRQEPPVLRRELLLYARIVSKIRLLERHDKMDKMVKVMVPMSTCEQPQRHSKPCNEANKQFLHAAAGSNGLLRAAGVNSGWRASPRMLPKNAMIVSPRLAPPSPLPTRHPQTQRALVQGHKTVC